MDKLGVLKKLKLLIPLAVICFLVFLQISSSEELNVSCSEIEQTADGLYYCADNNLVYDCIELEVEEDKIKCKYEDGEFELDEDNVFDSGAENYKWRDGVPVLKNVTVKNVNGKKYKSWVHIDKNKTVYTMFSKRVDNGISGTVLMSEKPYILEDGLVKTPEQARNLKDNSEGSYKVERLLEGKGWGIMTYGNYNYSCTEIFLEITDEEELDKDHNFLVNGEYYSSHNFESLGEKQEILLCVDGWIGEYNWTFNPTDTITSSSTHTNSSFRDTHVSGNAVTLNYGNEAAELKHFCYDTDDRMIPILFYIDIAEFVPSGVTIDNGTFRSRTQFDYGTATISFFEMRTNWTEGDGTGQAGNASHDAPRDGYENPDGTADWTTGTLDFKDNVQGEVLATCVDCWGAANDWINYDLKGLNGTDYATVQNWVDDRTSNFGMGGNVSCESANAGLIHYPRESGSPWEFEAAYTSNTAPVWSAIDDWVLLEDFSNITHDLDGNITDDGAYTISYSLNTSDEVVVEINNATNGLTVGYFATNFSGSVNLSLIVVDDGGLEDFISFDLVIFAVNDVPNWNPFGNDTKIKTATFYQPLNINASFNFTDVGNEDHQTPSNITISASSSTADCKMPSTADGNFSIFAKNSVDETFDCILNGTDSGVPSPELSAIESFQVTSETTFTSAFAQNITIADFDFASEVYETIENITFNSTKVETNFTVLSSFNLGKSGGGSRTVSARILVNGKEKEVEDLLTLSGTEELSTGIKPFEFELASGEHSVELQIKSSGSGVISVTDIDFILLEFVSSQDELIDDSVVNVSATVTSTGFTNIFESVEEDVISASHTYYGKLAIDKDTSTSEDIYLFLSNLNVTDDDSPVSARYLSGSGDMGSMAVGFYGQPVGSHTIALYGRLSASDTVFVNGSLLRFMDTDEGENVISGFQSTSNSSQFNNTQSLTAGNTTLISHEQFLKNGTSMLLTAIVSFKSTSGSQTPIVWVNSSGCSSKKERTLKTNNDEANVKIFLECDVNGTYDLNIDVPAGETLDVLDESFFGYEVSEFSVGEVGIAPLSNDFITVNNSNVSGISNITWNVFEGVTDYDLGLFFTNFSLSTNIVSSFSGNSTNVTWTDFSDGDYYLMVTGNNAVGSVNNTAIFITIDNTEPNITLISPANNASLAVNVEQSFEFNVTDVHDVDNCTFVVNGASETLTTITKNVTQTFNKTFTDVANYYWYVNCTDELNNENASIKRLLTIYSPGAGSVSTGGGEQGGGTPSATVGYNMSFICQKVYDFKIVTGEDYDYKDVMQLQDEVFDEKTVIISLPTLNEFINNYETVCANITPSLKKDDGEVISFVDENVTPKDVGLVNISFPVIDPKRGFANLVTGYYIYFPGTSFGVNIHRSIGFPFEINIGKTKTLTTIQMESEGRLSGYKILSYFLELNLKDSNIYISGIKLWFIALLILLGLVFWKRKLLRVPFKNKRMKFLFSFGDHSKK